jgi:hypothetical protein
MKALTAPKIRCRILVASLAFVTIAASSLLVGIPTSVSAKVTKLAPPTLQCGASTQTSISLIVCGGAQGAPAGFSVQWMTCDDFEANGGWPVDSDDPSNPASFCKASFSGVPGCATNFSLTGPSGDHNCVTVEIGDNLFDECGASSTCANTPLECGTCYVFRAFAHNIPGGLNKSDFSADRVCSTVDCNEHQEPGCTFTQGYWKTHGPVGCLTGNNETAWPADVLANGLTLGTVGYTADELCSIFNKPAAGNGLISLAHQLIAAKINVANGADDTEVAQCIADADALIGGLGIPPVGSGSLSSDATSSLTTCLDNFNKGTTGPGHCP